MATKPSWVREELRKRRLAMMDKQGEVSGSRVLAAREIHEPDEQVEASKRPPSSSTTHQELQDEVALVVLLKACIKKKDLYQGNILHAAIVKRGLLDKNIIVGNSLVNFYSKCGALETAERVLRELSCRDVVSWTTLIAQFCERGQCSEALRCFDSMKLEGLSPDPTTLASILKACGKASDVERGKDVHAEIVREGWLEEDVVLGSALLDMYAKCGELAKAQQVFNELPARDLVSWNSLIAGYAQLGYGDEALNYFQQSLLEGLTPDSVTFTCILKACASIRAVQEGQRLHAEIAGKGLLGEDVVLGSALVDMYAKCGALAHARQVFDELPSRNEVSWTGLITGFCQHGHSEEALACFEQMKHHGLSPDRVTFACILKACGSAAAAEKGKHVHGEILRLGLLGNDTVLGNALVDMYGKCGALTEAQEVFDNLPVQNLVSWNALISGYSQHGHGEEALTCFEQLESAGLLPDAVTYACILKACGSIGAAEEGKEAHAEVARRGLLGMGAVVGNALVDMYSKCGALAMAHQVFDELPVRDIVSWNALITGYCEHGYGEQGLELFECMKDEGLHPDAVTFACILKACGKIEAPEEGEGVHNEIVKEGLLESVGILGNMLVDMYGKCGVHIKAHQLFEQLPVRDVVSWNTLIAGCCKNAHGEEALRYYELMKCDSISPDAVTLACILKACGSIGATKKGEDVFAEIIVKGFWETVDMYAKWSVPVRAQYGLDDRDMVSWNTLTAVYGLDVEARTDDGIMPSLKHQACMVELLGLAGHFDNAMEVMKRLPSFALAAESSSDQKSGIIVEGWFVKRQLLLEQA